MHLIPAQRAAQRAIILKALIARAQAESLVARKSPAAQRWYEIARDIAAWLHDEGFDPLLNAREGEQLRSALGSWQSGEDVVVLQEAEDLTAILWALNELESMPPYYQRVDPGVILPKVPLLQPTAAFANPNRTLRSEDAILSERRTAQFWRWRAEVEDARRRGLPLRAGTSYDHVILHGTTAAAHELGIGPIASGDVSVGELPFRDLSDMDFLITKSIASHRLLALNWISSVSDSATVHGDVLGAFPWRSSS